MKGEVGKCVDKMDLEWECQKQLRSNRLGHHIPPWSKPYHYQTRWQALENRSNLINFCCLWVSKCFHLFNFLLSGLLLQHWPKEKCVPHPQGLSFTVCSFPLPLIGSSSKIMRVFFSVSCYNLLPLGWPRYTAADSCRAWCSRRTRCWSSTLLSVRWWAIISAGLIFFVRDWCTGQLNSPGDCKLQASALGFTMEKWAYLNSCYSCFSAQYWLLLWDKRQAVAYRKHAL